MNGLESAARTLNDTGALGAADQAWGLHDRTRDLHTEISRAARVAHRAERPEFYDHTGRWVGRQDGKGQD
ncbi:hypothetical protein [Promicromonospora sp. NPDC050880]|uniref:hypothetical protein n=1 Tax=Promicromonospora sp. NPDC050880 TaxID=3364406 RepID=UPI00379C23C7